jgi:acyl carrier protein
MTTDHVEEDLRQLFAQVMDLRTSQIHPDISQINCASWTSLNHLMLVSQIESQFGVTFTNAEISAMTSYGRVAQTLAQHLAPV